MGWESCGVAAGRSRLQRVEPLLGTAGVLARVAVRLLLAVVVERVDGGRPQLVAALLPDVPVERADRRAADALAVVVVGATVARAHEAGVAGLDRAAEVHAGVRDDR